MPKGEVGSIPTPATKLGYQLGLSSGSGRLCKSTPARFDSSATHQDSSRGQHKGAGDPCNLRKSNRFGMRPLRMPVEPTSQQLIAAKRMFPPNYLHESWLDYLYWDSEIEN